MTELSNKTVGLEIADSIQMLELDYYVCKPADVEVFASLCRNATTSSDELTKYRALVRVRPTAQEK